MERVESKCPMMSMMIFTFVHLNSATGATWRQDESYHNLLPSAVDTASAFYTRSKIHCSVLCQTDSSCNSFFYNDVSRLCLRQRVVHVSPNDAVLAMGWRYFRFTAESCPQNVNPTHHDYVIDRVSMTCYRVVTSQKLAWVEAGEVCKHNKEQMTVLEPVEKAAFIDEFMNANKVYPRGPDEYYYIGGSRPELRWNSAFPATGPDYVWLSGQPVNYTATAFFWITGKPDNYNNGENAMALTSGMSFGWEDLLRAG